MAPAGQGMLNGIGIQNPGIDAWRGTMPELSTLPVPVWGSAVGTTAAEFALVAKGLAASGDTKYQALLQEVATQAPSSKLQRYANQSIDLFAKYQERIRILNATADWDASLNAEENQFIEY